MATVTVNVSCSEIKQALHGSRLGQFAANEAMKGMDDYVPYRTGQLADSASAKPWQVSYSANHARPVYYGTRKRFNRSMHAKACALWGDAYAKSNGAKLAKAMTNYLKRGA